MNGIEEIIAQNVSAVIMAVVFIWYLDRNNKRNEERYDKFDRTINNHLSHATDAQIQSAKANEILARQLSDLTKVITRFIKRK